MAEQTMAFADEATRDAVDWRVAWAHFQPKTPFGLAASEALQPYRPGEEAAYREALAQLRLDCAQTEVWSHSGLADILEQLPDIRPALASLARGIGSLGMKDCLALKQFLWRTWPVLAADLVPSTLGSWTQTQHWQILRDVFGADTEATFSAEQIGGDRVKRADQAYGQAVREQTAASRTQSNRWFERTGLRMTRDGWLVFRMPIHQPLADVWACHPELKWLRDTPFERVFEVVPTPEVQMACDHVNAAQRQMEAAHDEALRSFTTTLRQQLPSWYAVLRDVTALDVRLAKVEAYITQRGCVPDYDPTELTLSGAVDEVASTELATHGKSFRPMEVVLRSGLNVVTGPNMSGKTVRLRTWCVCQLLAQYALPVPARRMTTRLFNGVRMLADAHTDVARGLSSFAQEVVRVAEVIAQIDVHPDMLVCLDEPFRTTNPLEGEALVVAVGRHFQMRMCGAGAAVVATHFTAPLREREAHLIDVDVDAHSGAGHTALAVAASLGLPASLVGEAGTVLQEAFGGRTQGGVHSGIQVISE